MILRWENVKSQLKELGHKTSYRKVGKETGIKWQRIHDYATKKDGQMRKDYIRILTTYFRTYGLSDGDIWLIDEQAGPPAPIRKKEIEQDAKE